MRYGFMSILLAMTISTNVAQTTYYVANTGNDANDGKSVAKPFQSLTKVNSLRLAPGDAVLFRRNDVFRGSLRIRQSGTASKPIRYDAYGSGDKPLLAGSALISNWVNLGNNRWQASCPSCGNRVTGVYANGSSQPLGRFPNPDAPDRGNLTVDAHAGTSQLTSKEPLAVNWTGAEVVLRPTYWIIDRATVAQQAGNTLTLTNSSTYPLTDGWGYFIQNHPATLDQPGEWYYNPANYTIQFYATSNNPAGQSITATTEDRVIDIASTSFITIQNLHVAQARATNLYALNVSKLTLTNTDFTDSGEDGVVIQGSGNTILIDNCSITNSNNNGLLIGSYQDVTVRRNTIRRSGIFPGRGKSGDGQFTALQSFTTQNTFIENNIIDSVGYIGLSVQSNTIVRQNVISNFCMVKSDGGGIYLWNGNQSSMYNIALQSNIIRNGIGVPGAVSDTIPSGAHGIFLDDCVKGVDLTDNTIADCQGIGIYMHAVSNVNLLRNVCFNNSVGQLILYRYDGPCLPRNNVIRQNVLVARTATQPVVGYISSANDLVSFGSIDQNFYVRPFNELSTIRSVYNGNIVNDLSLSQWQAQFGLDATSRSSPITYRDYTVTGLSNTSRISDGFDGSLAGWETWSPYGNSQATWSVNNLLDKGSLQINVSKLSNQSDSYVLAYKSIQAVNEAKTYLLQFTAVANTEQKVVVFIRQRQGPFQDLSRRYEFMVGPWRTNYEFALTTQASEADALLTFQFRESTQPVWFDNVSLREATISAVNADNFVRMVYNPTLKDSTILLNEPYRDVRNHYYTRQVVLKSFSSLILLRDLFPPVDVRLSLQANRAFVRTGDITSYSLSLHNESAATTADGNRVEWSCRLPAGLELENSDGFIFKDSLLTGTVANLRSDTTIVFTVKAMQNGHYTLAAEVTATTYADPDSTPNSGMDDGEDDTASITLLAGEDIITEVELPNPPIRESTIYPNPSTTAFQFTAEADVAAIRIVDLLGREQLVLGAVQRGQPIYFGQELPGAYYLLYIQYKTGQQRVVKLLKL